MKDYKKEAIKKQKTIQENELAIAKKELQKAKTNNEDFFIEIWQAQVNEIEKTLKTLSKLEEEE